MGISDSVVCLPHPHLLYTSDQKLPRKAAHGTDNGLCHARSNCSHGESLRILRNLVAADGRLRSSCNDEEGFGRFLGRFRV